MKNKVLSSQTFFRIICVLFGVSRKKRKKGESFSEKTAGRHQGFGGGRPSVFGFDLAYRHFGGHQGIDGIVKLDTGRGIADQNDVIPPVVHRQDAMVASDHAPVGGKSGIEQMKDFFLRQQGVQLGPGVDDGFSGERFCER